MSIYDRDERNTEAKDKVEFVEVAEVKEPDLRPTCRAHGLGMSRVGKSERGIPEYLCPQGCKREAGISRVIKNFPKRGYGFLALKDGAEKGLFFHYSQIKGSTEVEVGEAFAFEIGINERKDRIQAVNLRRLEEPSLQGGKTSG